MNWRLLPTISAPMPLQMAFDELLFLAHIKENHPPLLRFYISPEPWISVGYSFRGTLDLSRSVLIRQNPQIPVCRRVTGGGCVLHGRDLIFSLIARSDDQKSLSSVRASYEKIHESVKMGLQECGLDPQFYDPEEKLPKGSDCFDFPVESDLSWKGQKIAGGAQKRSEGALLHHESIKIPWGIDRAELAAGIRRGFEAVFGISACAVDLDPEVYFRAERCAHSRCKNEVGEHGRICELS